MKQWLVGTVKALQTDGKRENFLFKRNFEEKSIKKSNKRQKCKFKLNRTTTFRTTLVMT